MGGMPAPIHGVSILVSSILALVLAFPAAANPEKLTLEAFLEVPVLHGLSLSPDGRKVAYVRTQRSIADDKRTSQVWIAEVHDGSKRQITFVDEGANHPAWRMDGWLTYLSDRGGTTQVWLNPLDGAEPRPITDLEQGVIDYWWAPDGHHLAVLASPPDEDEDKDEDEDEAEAEAGDDSDAPPEGDFTVFDRLEDPDTYPQLWLLSTADDGPADEPPRQITTPPLHAYHVAWSPDGNWIALTFNPRFSSLVDEEQQVAMVNIESGELVPISAADRHSSLAAFSPDGGKLAYFTDRGPDLRAYMNLKDLIVRDLATGDEIVMTGGWPYGFGGAGNTPWLPPVWSADGKAVYLLVAEGTSLDLYRAALSDRSLEAVTDLAGNLRSFDIRADQLVYVESELHRPGSLRTRRLRGRADPMQLDTTDGAVAAFDLQAPEKITLPGGDKDLTIEGFLFLPPGAEREGKHALIVEMHGGPYYRYGNAWSSRYPWHVLVQEGFAVFLANPRGGTGYGEEFIRAIYRGFGQKDFDDLMAAVDALVEQGIADPERLGFTGYSYGGLMTNVVVSKTDRFAAAVSIAGIWNYVSALGQSNPQLLIDSYERPWDTDLATLWGDSPASRAAAITTPTLLMHGRNDRPVDPRQSIEMFTFLQLNAVPSRLVLYEGEGHGINRPVHMVDYETREIEWFRHYLLGDRKAKGAAEPLPVEPPLPPVE